jgi:Holliday junction DNA helicase RuvA
MNILSGAPVDRILQMIEAEDVKGLTLLPKVGKKTAEQLILSLKGKLPQLEIADKPSAMTSVKSGFVGAKSEILSALINLGFRSPDVESVVQGLPAGIEFEEGVRKSLASLAQGV